MQSIYILQFKSQGEMEDIVVYLDMDKAFNSLKLKWETRTLLEYSVMDGVSHRIIHMYVCDKDGNITQFKF